MKAKNRKRKLEKRRGDYDKMIAGRTDTEGYKKPGSNKK